MSFKDTQSYKELQADWRWIHSMDPEAAAAADQWVKEHPEEWKELEHMLYYSEANFHKRVAPDTLEDVDIKQPISYNPEAFLPEEVRNAIYDDMRWFDRAKYLPEGSDEDPLMYVRKEIDEGLRELTELQREYSGRFCSAPSSTASPPSPSHRTSSAHPETSGISAPVRFDRYGPKSKDVKATADPTLSSLFCCLCCLLVFRLLAGENSFGPHIPGWSLWLQCLAHWLWLSCSKIPFAEKQKVCCARIMYNKLRKLKRA